MAVNVEFLENMVSQGCQHPECTHEDHSTLYFNARCHAGGAVEASYTKGSGEIVIACRVCHKEIVRVAVKSGTDPNFHKN